MGMGPLGVRCTEMVWNAPTMNLLYVHWSMLDFTVLRARFAST